MIKCCKKGEKQTEGSFSTFFTWLQSDADWLHIQINPLDSLQKYDTSVFFQNLICTFTFKVHLNTCFI